MASVLVLTAITGAQVGRRLTATGRSASIGSGNNNDIVLSERSIALKHAELRQILDRWFIAPLVPGTSGISLNGMPVTAQSRLNADDHLTLGSVTYRVSFAAEVERAVGAPPPTSTGVPRLGEYFLRRGMMTRDQVSKAVDRQGELQRSGVQRQFGQVAHELGFISRGQLDTALADQRSDFNTRFSD